MFNLILVDRGRLTNYLWGFIGCATWLIVAIMNHLVGDIFAQIFYVTMQFVGVWVRQRQLDRQEKNEYEEVNAIWQCTAATPRAFAASAMATLRGP